MKYYLECPCCGCEGAESDDEGLFYEDQPTLCGCAVWVSVDDDVADLSWDDSEPCPVCKEEA